MTISKVSDQTKTFKNKNEVVIIDYSIDDETEDDIIEYANKKSNGMLSNKLLKDKHLQLTIEFDDGSYVSTGFRDAGEDMLILYDYDFDIGDRQPVGFSLTILT